MRLPAEHPQDRQPGLPNSPQHNAVQPTSHDVPAAVDRLFSGSIDHGHAPNQLRTHFCIEPAPPAPVGFDRSTREQFLRSRVNSRYPDVECQLKNTYHRYEFEISVTRPDVYALRTSYPPNPDRPERELPMVYQRRNRCAAEGVAATLGEIFVATGSIPERFIFVFRSPETYITEVSPDDDVDSVLDAFETTSYSVAGCGAVVDWQSRLDEELERLAAQRRVNPALGG